MKLNIKIKLLGAFLAVVALMGVIIVVVYVNLQTIARASERVLDEEFPVADHAMNLMVLARQEQDLWTDLALTGSQEVRDEIGVMRRAFQAEVAAMRPLLEGEEILLVEEVVGDEEHVADVGLEMADLFVAGEREAGLAKMTEFDGLEACRHLKENPQTADIPVVVLTVHSDRADVVLQGIDLGAVDFIPKDSFSHAVILETLRQLHILDGPKG